MQEILQQTIFHNSIEKYMVSLLIFSAIVIALKFIDAIIISRLKALVEQTSKFDELIFINLEKTVMPALYFAAFYMAVRGLVLNQTLAMTIEIFGKIILTFSGIRFFVAVADFTLEVALKKKDNVEKERSLKVIMPILKVMVWGIGFVFLLDNLGFQISAVVAGLGIGGIAVALAAQAVLGDLFSYVAIVFDQPFELGDFIVIGEHAGTIEHIGIKTTRIRSLGGEQLVFANSDLTNSRIKNYKRMSTRRVVFKLGVVYSTSINQLKEIPKIVRDVIEAIEGTKFDRAHFTAFGDFSLDFEIVYYVNGNDYTQYMDIHQAINLRLKEEFEQHSIEFAYPTQTLLLNK